MKAFLPRYTITDRIAAALTDIERARGFLEAATLSDDWIKRMADRALVLEAHHTTHIEGTHLTLEQAERLMAGESVPEADPDDTRELLNYRDAFNFVSEYLDDRGPITEGLVREVHKRLVQGVRGGTALPGQYRAVQNYVVNSGTGETVYTPPPPGDVPELMRALVAWLNDPDETHPVLVSAISQFQLVHIHPFCDGNGRVSRLLSTLCLYREGYDFKRLFAISEFYDRDRAAFYRAIQSVRKEGMDLTGWIEFFVTGLETQMQEVKERGRRVIQVDVLAGKHGLNERQRDVLLYMTERKGVTIHRLLDVFPGIPKRTMQRDIRQLSDKKLLKAHGSTNNRAYALNMRALR